MDATRKYNLAARFGPWRVRPRGRTRGPGTRGAAMRPIYDRGLALDLVREAIEAAGGVKAFAARHGLGQSTLHQQLNGGREPSLRVAVQAMVEADDWALLDYLNALRGLRDDAPAGEPVLALVMSSTGVQSRLGDVAASLEDAVAPDSPGGAAIVDEELADIERLGLELWRAVQRLLGTTRGLRALLRAAHEQRRQRRRAG